MDVNGNHRMEGIKSVFEGLELQGVDTTQKLLYGYFFYDKEKPKLENLMAALLKESYVLVRLEQVEDGDFILHVEKIEAHSRESLFEREAELRSLARRFSVREYDGWDVGNVDPSKPLVSNESFLSFMNSKRESELFELGIRLYDHDINDRASEVFRECLKQNIKPDVSSFKLAGALFELGKMDEGIASLEEAIKLNPQYIDAYFNLGVVYYDLGKFQKSLENYENADRLRPNDHETVFGIATTQFALGDFKNSLENCKKSLKLNPENENAKILLEKLNRK